MAYVKDITSIEVVMFNDVVIPDQEAIWYKKSAIVLDAMHNELFKCNETKKHIHDLKLNDICFGKIKYFRGMI